MQHEIDEAVKAAELEGIVDIANAKKSLHLFYTASKQCMPKITSVSFLGYCFPTTPLDQILLNESNATRDGDSSSNETSTGLTISTESETRPSSDFFDKAIADAATAKYVIFSFGCGMSLCLGIIFLIILQARILSILVWTMILSVDAGLLGAGIYTKQVSLTWASGARPGNEAVALFYASYVLYWLAGLWVCVVLYLRKRIVLAIACVREASSAISSQPVISLYPVLQVLGLFTFSIVWGICEFCQSMCLSFPMMN